MPDTVAVIGGGIAGLTVAHELLARGVPVTLYEARGESELGGKCRSQYFESDKIPGSRLPGEHGFRFFPGWYVNVPNLMRRIPLQIGGPLDPERLIDKGFEQSVANRLVASETMGMSWPGQPMGVVDLGAPDLSNPLELGRWLFQFWRVFGGAGIGFGDAARLSFGFVKFLSTCEARRESELDAQSLWEYLECDKLSVAAQSAMRVLPKSLVAMNAREGNARTFLNTLYLMCTEWTVPGQAPHRVLNGPTSETWLEPWRKVLEKLGISWHFETRVTHLEANDQGVTGLYLDGGTQPITHSRGYVLAVPIEAAHHMLAASPTVTARCPDAKNLATLDPRACTSTMTGVQLFFAEPTNTIKGHFALCESEWGLTAVSQERFWSTAHLPPGIQGLLSLCLTDLTRPVPGIGNISAQQASRDQLIKGVLWQLSAGQGLDGEPMTTKAPHVWHIDEDLDFNANGVGIKGDRSRLLIHPPGQLQWRPREASALPNLFYAGDHVRNPADLATMEGAVCSASMAVNAWLLRTGHNGPKCKTFSGHRESLEPKAFAWAKKVDAALYPTLKSRYLEERRSDPPDTLPDALGWLDHEIEALLNLQKRDGALHGVKRDEGP